MLGFYLAKTLLEEEHDLVIIEKNKERAEELAEKLNIDVINGDGTDPEVLETANIRESDGVVVITGNDETNLIIGLLAKQKGAKKVAVRLEKMHYTEELVKKLGIDIAIHPKAAAANYIEEILTKPEVLDLAFFSRGDAVILEMIVKEKSSFANKKIKDVSLPEGSSLIAVYEGKRMIIPPDDYVLKPGQKILILANKGVADRIKEV